MDKKKILVVEDEKAIADILVFNLQREGYDTLVAYDGAEGLRRALEDAPDLILLDVMLPEMDGFAVLGHIREKQDTPIIMLTAREEETDKVLGLELGADDYITKPFSMRELMARVKANMRRTLSGEEREKPAVPQGGGLRISRDNGMVYKNGRALELSAREFDILCFLSASPGRGGQEAQDIELARGKLERTAVFIHHAVVARDAQAAALRHGGLFPLLAGQRAAHIGLDARHQLAHGKRLGDIVVRAQLEAEHLVGLLLAGSEHDDRRVLFFADMPKDGKAVHLGQHHVQQDQIGCILQRAAQALGPVIRHERVVPLALQVEHQNIRDRLFILNDQNFFLIHKNLLIRQAGCAGISTAL